MKKLSSIIAAFSLFAAMAVIAVSCQKENEPTPSSHNTSKASYKPPKVDDMLAYLKDFKQKIQVRGNDQTMKLDEASWHLSSLANYDFGDVKKDYSGFRYDTLYNQIIVNNGTVSLSDINTAYNNISNQIVGFYQNLELENASPWYIDANIDEDGVIEIALMTSFRDWGDHYWYLPDGYGVADSILNSLGVGYDTCYVLYGNFNTQLQRILNILSGNPQSPSPGSGRIFYVSTRNVTFWYNQHFDPYGSPFESNSRIMYFIGHEVEVCFDEIAYCVDSYMGLAWDELQTDEVIINWMPFDWGHVAPEKIIYTYHIPTVKYGIPIVIIDDPLQ